MLVLVLACVAGIVQWQRASEAPMPEDTARPVWTLDGVAIGESYADLVARLGRPTSGSDDGTWWRIQGWGPLEAATLLKQPEADSWKVSGLTGSQLARNGEPVLKVGSPWNERSARLGKATRTTDTWECYSYQLDRPMDFLGKATSKGRIVLIRQGEMVSELQLECLK